jgi:ATP-binding cassette subfamily B protein/subfamily B ATP-binding cassette protein MsbA
MNQGNKHGFKSALEPTKTPGAWGLMVELFRPHRWALLAAFSFNAIHGFAITFQVFTVGWFVDWVLGKGDIPPNMWGRLSTLALGYFFTSTFGRMLCWHVGYRIFTRVREHVVAELRERFFRQLNALCLRFHMKRGSGELFSYLFGSPMQNIVGFYQHCSTGLAGAITTSALP